MKDFLCLERPFLVSAEPHAQVIFGCERKIAVFSRFQKRDVSGT